MTAALLGEWPLTGSPTAFPVHPQSRLNPIGAHPRALVTMPTVFNILQSQSESALVVSIAAFQIKLNQLINIY